MQRSDTITGRSNNLSSSRVQMLFLLFLNKPKLRSLDKFVLYLYKNRPRKMKNPEQTDNIRSNIAVGHIFMCLDLLKYNGFISAV